MDKSKVFTINKIMTKEKGVGEEEEIENEDAEDLVVEALSIMILWSLIVMLSC